MLTNAEMIRELAKPGKVYAPVVTKNDVVHLAIEKAYLIDLLKQQEPDEPAWWCFYGNDQRRGGDRWIDIQD
jgi:hypothetical protein